MEIPSQSQRFPSLYWTLILNAESLQVRSSHFLPVCAAAGEPARCVRGLHRKLRGRRGSGPTELALGRPLPAAGWGNADSAPSVYTTITRFGWCNWQLSHHVSSVQSMMPNNNNNSSDKTHNTYTFEGTVYPVNGLLMNLKLCRWPHSWLPGRCCCCCCCSSAVQTSGQSHQDHASPASKTLNLLLKYIHTQVQKFVVTDSFLHWTAL